MDREFIQKYLKDFSDLISLSYEIIDSLIQHSLNQQEFLQYV